MTVVTRLIDGVPCGDLIDIVPICEKCHCITDLDNASWLNLVNPDGTIRCLKCGGPTVIHLNDPEPEDASDAMGDVVDEAEAPQ